MRALVVAVGLFAACNIEPGLVECPGDVLCPVGAVCEPIHGGCVVPAQLEICVGIEDGERCATGAIAGYCLDEVCINPGCGNHVVDPSEVCDDGNRTGGDGCSSTCTSAERCGDGATDSAFDEECDDGNLLSRDGCDSRCLRETSVWTVDEIGPRFGASDLMTWDPVRQRIVMLTDQLIWGWSGTQWAVIGTTPSFAAVYDVTYDTDRNVLVVIAAEPATSDGLDPSPPRTKLFEWNGTTWTTSDLTSAPDFDEDFFSIVYDPVRKRVFAFGHTDGSLAAGTLDLATRAWATAPVPTGTLDGAGFSLAFDVARGKVVVVTEGSTQITPSVNEWNGVGWTTSSPAMAVRDGWSLYYDAVLQRVVAVGAASLTDSTTVVQSWSGTAWSSLPSVPNARRHPGVGFDRVRNVAMVFGGESFLSGDDVYERGQAAWTESPLRVPPAGVWDQCAFDNLAERYICAGRGLTNQRETWAWHAGTWSKLAGGYIDDFRGMAYDPTRAKLVAWPMSGGVYLDGDTWQPLPLNADVGSEGNGMVFDPIGKRLVISSNSSISGGPHTSILEPDNTFHRFPSNVFTSLAFDARNGSVIGSNGSGSEVLVGETWSPAVAPGNDTTVYTNARRGTVEFYTRGVRVVERVGVSFNELPELPPYAISGRPAMNPHTGELHVLGFKGNSRFMLHRSWQSATPLESCVAGEDVDGDGLAGCDDKDCWLECTPLCPPYAACP